VWSPNGKLIAYADPAGTKLVIVATKRTITIPLMAGSSPGLGWAVVAWLPLN
jgi:hypothetical protein